MTFDELAVKRLLVGILAVICLTAGAALWLIHGGSFGDARQALWISGLMRGGIVLAALWYALPSWSRDMPWSHRSLRLLGAIVVALLAITRRLPLRVLLPLALGLVVLLILLRPRSRRRPRLRR